MLIHVLMMYIHICGGGVRTRHSSTSGQTRQQGPINQMGVWVCRGHAHMECSVRSTVHNNRCASRIAFPPKSPGSGAGFTGSYMYKQPIRTAATRLLPERVHVFARSTYGVRIHGSHNPHTHSVATCKASDPSTVWSHANRKQGWTTSSAESAGDVSPNRRSSAQ